METKSCEGGFRGGRVYLRLGPQESVKEGKLDLGFKDEKFNRERGKEGILQKEQYE